jgi:hypothetical protein
LWTCCEGGRAQLRERLPSGAWLWGVGQPQHQRKLVAASWSG